MHTQHQGNQASSVGKKLALKVVHQHQINYLIPSYLAGRSKLILSHPVLSQPVKELANQRAKLQGRDTSPGSQQSLKIK